MALMTWNGSFSVGVQAMDEQHKGLVKALNDLHAAMMEGQAKSKIGELMQTLVRYAREHFAAEEALMRRAQYPQCTEHCAQHKSLADQVDRFVVRFERGEAGLNAELLTFLRNWMTRHIQKTDRDYGSWINGHGAQ